jgi:hypothetical protein
MVIVTRMLLVAVAASTQELACKTTQSTRGSLLVAVLVVTAASTTQERLCHSSKTRGASRGVVVSARATSTEERLCHASYAGRVVLRLAAHACCHLEGLGL